MKNNCTKHSINLLKGANSMFKALFAALYLIFKKRTAGLNNQSESYCKIPECNYEKCTGCGLCAEVCPIKGVFSVKEDDENVKKPAIIDITKCTSCGNCVYFCPKGALNMTKLYKLATNDKKALKLDYKKNFEAKMEKIPEFQDIPAFVNEEET